MDEHQGSAPCIPVWKTGVYLSTPMLENEIGVPCESCTRLRGFADHCLGCSANGTWLKLDDKRRVEACVRFGWITARVYDDLSAADGEIRAIMNVAMNPQNCSTFRDERFEV